MGDKKNLNRITELQFFENYVNSHKANFISVYCRHKIDKILLIKKIFDVLFDFYMTCIYKNAKNDKLININYLINKYYGVYHLLVNICMARFTQPQD